MAEFREEDHPRDDKGRFSEGALSKAAEVWRNRDTYTKNDDFSKSFSKKGKEKTKHMINEEAERLYQKIKGIENEFQEKTGVSHHTAQFYRDNKDFGAERQELQAAIKKLPEYEAKWKPLQEKIEGLRKEFYQRGSPVVGRTTDEDKLTYGTKFDAAKKSEWNKTKLKDAQRRQVFNKLTGEEGKQPRKLTEETKKKMAEGREVAKKLGQKDAPVDLLDLAALQLDPKTGERSQWQRQKNREHDFSQQARSLVNQTVGKYLAGDKTPFQNSWYGHYDPKTGREVEHISDYDLDKPIGGNFRRHDLRNKEKNEYLRLKDSKGNDVEVDDRILASGGPGSYNRYTASYDKEPKQTVREAAEAKGYKVVGPKEPGWYYKDSLQNDEPERVPGDDDHLRFPLAVHPAIADKTFPGTKKTYAQVAFEAVNKYTSWEKTGNAGYGSADHNEGRSEYSGIDSDLNAEKERELDKVTLKIWKKLEPQIRADMAKDSGYNRFWTDNHIQEGSGGGKYGGVVMGLGGGIETDRYDKEAQKMVVDTEPLSKKLRKWASGEEGKKTLATHLKARPWNEDAWAGKVDPFTEDPMTKAQAAERGVLKKYVEGVRAKDKKTP